MLTIYDSNGNRRTDIEAGDSSTQVKEVQGDNVLTLSFTHYEYIALDVNDRVDFEGERYWLTERYTPKQKSGQEWVYDLKFYGIESLVRRFLVLETTDGNTEPVFTLTATPREHVAMIVKCINDGMNHTTDWKVGRVDGTDLIVIDYEGKYCNEALKEIAEAVGGQAEWWVEGQTVNVCRCEHGEEITLGYGKGLTGIERDTTGTDNFYTRLFPVGSTRNIDPSKYGHSRLMLPGGRQYVEIHTEEYGIYDRYEQDAFSGIYPRRIGAVSSVRSEDVKDDDGNPFTVYYFRDDSLNFDPNDYELPVLFAPSEYVEAFIPFNITCGTLLKYQILLAFTCTISVTGITLLMSAISKNQIVALVAAMAIFLFPVLLPIPETNPLFRLVGLLPVYHVLAVSLLSVEQMSNGMLYAIWAIPTALIFLGIGAGFSRHIFAKHQVS